MKRVLSVVFAAALLVGLLSVFPVAANATSGMKASEDCVNIMKQLEGFNAIPKWDYSQWTVGFGSRCPDDKLEEYKKFKLASEDLKDNITYIDDLYYRKKEEIVIDDTMDLDNISIDAIKNILPYILKVKSNESQSNKDEKLEKIVRGRIVPVEEKIAYIRKIIDINNEVSFTKVVENVDKDEVIATFLSVLELIKSREVIVCQDLCFDDILIKKNLES